MSHHTHADDIIKIYTPKIRKKRKYLKIIKIILADDVTAGKDDLSHKNHARS